MSIQRRWREEFGRLKEYVTANPEIYIDPREVSIPRHLRDAFYERFDATRSAVVDERYNDLTIDVNALRSGYVEAEKDVTDLLGLDRIDIPMDLSSFLHDPKGGLVRVLYNRLFELVQGKMNEEEFERLAALDIGITAGDLFRLGYEPWAALSLIRLLDPDRAYGVQLDEDYEPVICELKEIAFGRQFHHPAKRIPECILHSRRLDRNVAVKMPLAREVHSFYIPFEPPVKPKKRTGDTSFALDSRVMFLSVVPDLKKIPVFADIHARTITSPDLMVEFLSAREAADREAMDDVKKRAQIMKPKLGTCIVMIDPDPDAAVRPPEENIETVAVGFDPSKLEAIVDRLA